MARHASVAAAPSCRLARGLRRPGEPTPLPGVGGRPRRRAASSRWSACLAVPDVGHHRCSACACCRATRPRPRPHPTPAPPVDRAALATSPAQGAITRCSATAPAAGWSPAGSGDLDRRQPRSTRRAAARRLDAVAGRRARLLRRQGPGACSRVSAYTAGQGAPALAAWSMRAGRLRVVRRGWAACGSTAPGGCRRRGVAARRRRHRRGRRCSLAPRRRRGRRAPCPRPAPGGPRRALRTVVDPALVAALAGPLRRHRRRPVADAARSPWVSRAAVHRAHRAAHRRRRRPRRPRCRRPGVTPVPPTWSPSAAAVGLDPGAPGEPVWPADLPTRRRRVAAAAVGARAGTGAHGVPSRLDDPVGPGCGWAFTGQVAPPFDAGTEAVARRGARRAGGGATSPRRSRRRGRVAVVDYWQARRGLRSAGRRCTPPTPTACARSRAPGTRSPASAQEYADAVDGLQRGASRAREQFLARQAPPGGVRAARWRCAAAADAAAHRHRDTAAGRRRPPCRRRRRRPTAPVTPGARPRSRRSCSSLPPSCRRCRRSRRPAAPPTPTR